MTVERTADWILQALVEARDVINTIEQMAGRAHAFRESGNFEAARAAESELARSIVMNRKHIRKLVTEPLNEAIQHRGKPHVFIR